MTRLRRQAVLVVIALLMAACGGRDGSDEASEPPPDSSASPTSAVAADTTEPTEPTEATEIGVTEDRIVIGIVADVDNTLVPGAGQPMVSSVQAWADYVNDNGGLAGREVEVRFYDSHLNPDETTNAINTACDEAFALVGSAPLLMQNPAPLVECPDQAGEATGLPDLASLAITEASNQSSVTFGIVTNGRGASDPDAVVVPVGDLREAAAELGGTTEDVHGVIIDPGVGTAEQNAAYTEAFEQDGATMETPVVYGEDAPQAEATPIVQQIRSDDLNLVWSQGLGIGNIMAEAQVQGLDTDSIEWLCTQGCMGTRFLESGGDAIEGLDLATFLLPWTDDVPAVTDYRDRVPEEDYDENGLAAWAQGLAFGELVEQLVEQEGVNGLTRANLLELIRGGAPATGGGILPPDFEYGSNTTCHVWMVVEGGEFVGANPNTVQLGLQGCSLGVCLALDG